MPSTFDPSERERALRAADEELERLRAARPAGGRRDVHDESWLELGLTALFQVVNANTIAKGLIALLIAIALVVNVCSSI